VQEFEGINGWFSMPQMAAAAGADPSSLDKLKTESAMSSAAPSPSPSTASSKEERVKNGKGGSEGKDKDTIEANAEEGSVDGDVSNETEKKTPIEVIVGDDVVKSNTEKEEPAKTVNGDLKEQEVKEEADEGETKTEIKDG